MTEREICDAVKIEMLKIVEKVAQKRRYDEFDKLNGIFALQEDYQKGTYKLNMYPKTMDERIYKLSTAIIHEATELQRLTRSLKWWKKSTPLLDNSQPNQVLARGELIDIVHFTVHAAIELRMSALDMWAEYYAKNAVNRQRVRDNY